MRPSIVCAALCLSQAAACSRLWRMIFGAPAQSSVVTVEEMAALKLQEIYSDGRLAPADTTSLAALCITGTVSLKAEMYWAGFTLSSDTVRRRVDTAIALHRAAMKRTVSAFGEGTEGIRSLLLAVHSLIVPEEFSSRDVVVLLSQFGGKGVSDYGDIFLLLVQKLAKRSFPYESIEDEINHVRESLRTDGHGEMLDRLDRDLDDDTPHRSSPVPPMSGETSPKKHVDSYSLDTESYNDMIYNIMWTALTHGWLDIVTTLFATDGPYAALFHLTGRVLERMIISVGCVSGISEQRTSSLLHFVAQAIVHCVANAPAAVLAAPELTQNAFVPRSLFDSPDFGSVLNYEYRRTPLQLYRDARRVFNYPTLSSTSSSNELVRRMSTDSLLDERQRLRKSPSIETPQPELFPGVDGHFALRLASLLACELATRDGISFGGRYASRTLFRKESQKTWSDVAHAAAILTTYAVATLRLDGYTPLNKRNVETISSHASHIRAFVNIELYLECLDHILSMV